MIRGMEEGKYMVLFPDFTAVTISTVLAGTIPLSLPFLVAAVIAPFVVRINAAQMIICFSLDCTVSLTCTITVRYGRAHVPRSGCNNF